MDKKDQFGWIKIHRKLRDNPYMRKPAYRAVWIELLFEAEHGMKLVNKEWVKKDEKEMKSIIFKGERIYLKPGQLTCGIRQLSEWTGVPRGTVERILKAFKNEKMIETQTSNEFSLLQIVNWDYYQNNETQNEKPMRNERETNEKRMRLPKECKNDKNERKDIIEDNEKNIEIVDKPQTHKDFSFDHLEKAIEDKNEMYLYLVDKFALQRPDIGKAGARKELQKFCDFYGATSYGSKKRHWQKQKTFSVPLRLRTWFENVRVTKEYQEELEREKTKRMTEYYSNLSNNNQNG